ncbi:drought-induced 19 [Actinidia rufa]|uniref:Drought-induced 19 n=1 Tax=Actinidia rufa TaxID=165716 RepID=A0A7J0G8Y9_9ERIC|nr:drought-induced 19 [Actinidia rufa]
MDGDSWSARLSYASKRYQSALQSRSDMYMGFEEMDGDDDVREEFPCPFCSEYYDIVGLCCHIDDEHPVEAKNGVLISRSLAVDDHGLYYIIVGVHSSDWSSLLENQVPDDSTGSTKLGSGSGPIAFKDLNWN